MGRYFPFPLARALWSPGCSARVHVGLAKKVSDANGTREGKTGIGCQMHHGADFGKNIEGNIREKIGESDRHTDAELGIVVQLQSSSSTDVKWERAFWDGKEVKKMGEVIDVEWKTVLAGERPCGGGING